MTEEIKNTLIEKMIDRPDELTSDEIMAICSDEELRNLYEISTKLQDTLQPAPQTPVTQEWDMFSRRLSIRRPKKRLYLHLVQSAAAVAGILLISAVIVKITGHAPSAQCPSLTADVISTDITKNPADTIRCQNDKLVTTLKNDASHIADASKPDKNRSPKKAKSASTPTATPDFDEYLRIEQARIDNEIAMAMAEVYEAEYLASLEADCAFNMDDGNVSTEGNNDNSYTDRIDLNKITML